MTSRIDIDNFTSTYLHGSSAVPSSPDNFQTFSPPEKSSGFLDARSCSVEKRESLDLGDPEAEAHKFLRGLGETNKNIDEAMKNDYHGVNMSGSVEELKIDHSDLTGGRCSSENFGALKFSRDFNENIEFRDKTTSTDENGVHRNRSLNKDKRLSIIREGLINSSQLSRSVNDLSSSGYQHHRPSSMYNNKNFNHNRISFHDDYIMSRYKNQNHPLYASNHRDVLLPKQSNQWKTQCYDNTSIKSNNGDNQNQNEQTLNTLQEKYSKAVNDFKTLRSTLTENMERNLSRTEQIDHMSTRRSQENLRQNNNSLEVQSSSDFSSRGSSFQGQPPHDSDVIFRNKHNNLDRFSSQERLFQRFSDMNLEEKFGNPSLIQHHQYNHNQHQQQQQQQQHSFRSNRHTIIGTNNNYEMKNYVGHPGKQDLPITVEQSREFQSHLRDQAAKSNFERYLKGSFNSHNSFDRSQQHSLEDPGYGGSGSTSPRELDTLMINTSDRLSSRSGSIASRQSQCSVVASVDSGARMSYIGQHNSLVVVAIDFGTTFSGYAFSFTRDANSIHMMRRWDGGDPGVTNQKTPTTLLLKPDGTFHSFGFGARDFYHDLDANDAKKWLYFDKFKMTLHASEDLNSAVEIKAANGKGYPALKVFSHALKFFKEHVLAELSDQSTAKLLEEDITWVVTVPAIWKQPAKQFMRTAAYEAGIASFDNPDRLLIALEPEAASIFCRKLRIRDCVIEDDLKAKAGDDTLISEDFQGVTQYIVVDCGGGTVDLTVHELDVTQGTLKELHKGTGGPSGATGVDREFENLLKRIFDHDFIERFKIKRPAAWIDLMISFEAKKRTARPDNQSHLNISLPFSFIEYHKKHRKGTVENAIKKFKNPDIKWSSQGMLRFSANVMQTLFEPVVNEIIGHIQNLLLKPSLKQVEHLFLVGGFAESPLLQSCIREALDGRVRVIIPNDVGLAILKGAVLFGLDPTVVRVRRSAFTYGVGVLNKFDTEKHEQSKRVIKDGVVWCKDIFDCFVRVDESLGIGDRITRSYAPARSKQKSTVINIYCTENLDVLYTTDKGVTKCGKLRIEMPDVNPEEIPVEKRGKPRELQASMIFGDTEIKVSAVDVLSGKAARATIDFLNY